MRHNEIVIPIVAAFFCAAGRLFCWVHRWWTVSRLMKFQREPSLHGKAGLARGGSTTACDCPRFVYSGFSVIELLVVVSIIVVISAIAIPSIITVTQNYRIAGDTREVAAQLNLARMRAASLGTKTRVNFDLVANTHQVEVWSKSASAYQVENGVQPLSQGVVFGYGTISTPAGQQSTIAQGYPAEVGCTCIYFNSRGIATDASGSATANSAVYLKNSKGFSAIAVSLAGPPTSYKFNGTAWVPF